MTIVKRSNGFYPAFTNVFNDFWGSNWALPVQEKMEYTIPAVNVHETENDFIVEVAAPGYDKKDFTVQIENEVLTVSVEKRNENSEEQQNYKRREFIYSSFKRRFNVSNELINSENVSAQYENGILQVRIPKREEVKPKPAKMIEIQ